MNDVSHLLQAAVFRRCYVEPELLPKVVERRRYAAARNTNWQS